MYNLLSYLNLFTIALTILIIVIGRALWISTNRYHTEIAEDYWNREYLDYSDRLDNIVKPMRN